MPTQALLVTGDTYPNRRALRALGAVWQPKLTGYALPIDKRDAAAALQGLDIEPWDFDSDPFAPLSPDDLRAYRQDKQDRRAARLRERADLADARSQKASNRLSREEREFLSLGEPVKVGHHSERRHRKLIDKAWNSALEAGREAAYADDLRHRADWLQPARVAGDAAAARAAANEATRGKFALGDTVKDVVYGQGVIVRVNPKSFSVRTPSGFIYKEEPRHLTLIAKGNGEAQKPARKFKKGDQVVYYPHGRGQTVKNLPRWRAVILRATPNGYSISYTLGEFQYTKVAREDDLELAPAIESAA
jgi:hypothetical protein